MSHEGSEMCAGGTWDDEWSVEITFRPNPGESGKKYDKVGAAVLAAHEEFFLLGILYRKGQRHNVNIVAPSSHLFRTCGEGERKLSLDFYVCLQYFLHPGVLVPGQGTVKVHKMRSHIEVSPLACFICEDRHISIVDCQLAQLYL